MSSLVLHRKSILLINFKYLVFWGAGLHCTDSLKVQNHCEETQHSGQTHCTLCLFLLPQRIEFHLLQWWILFWVLKVYNKDKNICMHKTKQKINKQAKNQKAQCEDPFSEFPLSVFSETRKKKKRIKQSVIKEACSQSLISTCLHMCMLTSRSIFNVQPYPVQGHEGWLFDLEGIESLNLLVWVQKNGRCEAIHRIY